MPNTKPDFLLINHGSIYTLRAMTPEAKLWAEDNLPEDFNGAIEPRYVHHIIDGIEAEGLTFA